MAAYLLHIYGPTNLTKYDHFATNFAELVDLKIFIGRLNYEKKKS